MPIDPLEERAAKEQRVSSLVSGRDVDDELSVMRRNITDLKNRFSTRAEGLISKVRSARSGTRFGLLSIVEPTKVPPLM